VTAAWLLQGYSLLMFVNQVPCGSQPLSGAGFGADGASVFMSECRVQSVRTDACQEPVALHKSEQPCTASA
jgi:hypothetical protein